MRLTKRISCCDIFDLDYYLAKKIIKPLKEFRKKVSSYPSCEEINSLEEWQKILDEMIWSFEFFLSEESNLQETEEQNKRKQKGFELFGKYFNSLWL